MNHHHHHHHPRYHNHHQQQQTKAISTIAAAVTARRKQQRRRVGIPFFLLLVLITLFVALTVTFLVTVAVLSPLILTTTTSTTLSNYDSSSSSYLLDFLEDFTYAKPRRRPWRNNDSNTSNNSTNSASTDDHSNVSNIVPWVIFYHIYIPPRKGKVGQAKALEVVEEQLAQVAASRNNYYHLKSAKNNNNMTASQQQQQQQQHYHSITASSSLVVWTVYYTTSGVANVITTSWMRQACRAHFLNCIPTEPHLLVGDEDVTLNHLYDYCQYHKQQEDESSVVDSTRHDDDRAAVVVVYMHTKGTHHAAQGRNDAWRRHLTAAVTYPDCLHAVSTSTTTTTTTTTTTRQQEHDDFELLEKKCDVCGLQYVRCRIFWSLCIVQMIYLVFSSHDLFCLCISTTTTTTTMTTTRFYPIWTTFFTGNFWTARVSDDAMTISVLYYVYDLHVEIACRGRLTRFFLFLSVCVVAKVLLHSNALASTQLYASIARCGRFGISSIKCFFFFYYYYFVYFLASRALSCQ
jgi:dsRNA-specific ribonuclease